MTKASKLSPGPPGFKRLEDQRDDVGAEGVHLGVKLDAAYATPRSTSEASRVFLDHAVGFFGDFDRPLRLQERLRLPVASCQIPNTCGRLAFWDRRRTRIFGRQTRASRHWPLPACLLFFMRATVASTPAASQSSKGPRFPVEAEMHARSISTMELEISGMRLAE